MYWDELLCTNSPAPTVADIKAAFKKATEMPKPLSCIYSTEADWEIVRKHIARLTIDGIPLARICVQIMTTRAACQEACMVDIESGLRSAVWAGGELFDPVETARQWAKDNVVSA